MLLLLDLAHSAPTSEVVTMYHVNPKHFGPIPINMDTADEAGDLFFELMEVLTVPLACTDPARDPSSSFSCDNPEADDPSDVVNKLTVSVTGGFSSCNHLRAQTREVRSGALLRPLCSSQATDHLTARPPSSRTVGRRHVQHWPQWHGWARAHL